MNFDDQYCALPSKQRPQLVLSKVAHWQIRPKDFLNDMEKKDFQKINWQTSLQDGPLWMRLFFGLGSQFSAPTFNHQFLEECFLAWCIARPLEGNISLPGLSSADDMAKSKITPAFFISFEEILKGHKNPSTVSFLIKLAEKVEEGKNSSHVSGRLAKALIPFVINNSLSKDARQWWDSQATSKMYSFAQKSVIGQAEWLLDENILIEEECIKKQVADIFFNVLRHRFEAGWDFPLLPVASRITNHFKSEAGQIFTQKLALMNVTGAWPWLENRKEQKARRI